MELNLLHELGIMKDTNIKVKVFEENIEDNED